MDDQNEEYLMELEKLMSVEILMTFWSPNMDILAVITEENLLEGYRISFRAQRFFQIQQSQTIKSLCFSPDSQYIVYGLMDGTVKIIRTENGERVIVVDSLNNDEIQNLVCIEFDRLKSEEFLPFTKDSIENKLILSIAPHKNCNKNAIIKLNYFNDLKEDFTCLLLCEKQKTWLLINGFIPIASISYSHMFKLPFRLLYSNIHEEIYSVVAEEVGTRYELSLVCLDGTMLNSRKKDIIKYNCLITYISEVFNFIDTTYTQLEASVRNIIREYNSKINLIDDSSSPDIVPCTQLFRYLNTGVVSSTLINFFSREVYDSRILQKLDEQLTGLFTQLHDIILESVQNSLEKVTIFLKKLINYSKVTKFRDFGIQTSELEVIEEMIKRLYVLGEMMLVESTQAKFDIRNLLVWLNKATIKTCQQNEVQIQNTNSYLNKYTVDYNRLYSFLANEDKFKLMHLLNFFRKTDEKIQMQIPRPQFTLIKNRKPKKVDESMRENIAKLEKLLQVEDVKLQEEEKMQIEETYKSCKGEVRDLIILWKKISYKPVEYLTSQLSKSFQIHKIGIVELSQEFEFLFKPVVIDGQLLIYYVERSSTSDTLIRYNCIKRQRQTVVAKKSTILSLAVAQDIIVVLQNKITQKKMVVQVANEEFDGKDIVYGRKISSPDQVRDLKVNSSVRKLNSLVVGKNKLVIFD